MSLFQLQKFKYFADDVTKLDKADQFCYEVTIAFSSLRLSLTTDI